MKETIESQDENEKKPQVERTISFTLKPDLSVISPTVDQFEGDAQAFGWSEEQALDMGTGYREALANAIIYGCLGVDKNLETGERQKEVHKRKEQQTDNVVHITRILSPEEVRIVIRDDGNGFDIKDVLDPTSKELRYKDKGRGIYLMRSFFDTVEFNDKGNEVTLVLSDQGLIGRMDDAWEKKLPPRIDPKDVETFLGPDGLWHWHLIPEKTRNARGREEYERIRALWP